jgi:hypothetical protein
VTASTSFTSSTGTNRTNTFCCQVQANICDTSKTTKLYIFFLPIVGLESNTWGSVSVAAESMEIININIWGRGGGLVLTVLTYVIMFTFWHKVHFTLVYTSVFSPPPHPCSLPGGQRCEDVLGRGRSWRISVQWYFRLCLRVACRWGEGEPW